MSPRKRPYTPAPERLSGRAAVKLAGLDVEGDVSVLQQTNSLVKAHLAEVVETREDHVPCADADADRVRPLALVRELEGSVTDEGSGLFS